VEGREELASSLVLNVDAVLCVFEAVNDGNEYSLWKLLSPKVLGAPMTLVEYSAAMVVIIRELLDAVDRCLVVSESRLRDLKEVDNDSRYVGCTTMTRSLRARRHMLQT